MCKLASDRGGTAAKEVKPDTSAHEERFMRDDAKVNARFSQHSPAKPLTRATEYSYQTPGTEHDK